MRLRLILSFVFVALLSIASVVLIARRSTIREVRAFMYRGNMVQVDTLVESLKTYYQTNGSWEGVDELLLPGGGNRRGMGNQGMGAMMNQRLRLADENGQVLVDSRNILDQIRLSESELQQAQPITVSGRTAGYLLVESGMTMASDAGAFLVSRLNRAALIAGLIAGGIALIVALWLADRLIQPVRELTRAAARLAQGDLKRRVPVEGSDEISELGQAFNHMADSLQMAEQNRQEMTADIAHELRNPLAVQRAQLEAIQDGIFPPTPKSLQPVLDQNLLLTRLVEDLRTLALADAGQLQLEKTPTDCFQLVGRIVERVRPQASGRGINLSFATTPEIRSAPPVLMIDPMRVEQILGNLLSNAQRYTPPGGEIVVKMTRKGQTLQVSVVDGGPGIPPEALAHIFERFYRADRARSRAEGGSGLGLAIARQLAEAHHGSLTAMNAPQGGALMALELPI